MINDWQPIKTAPIDELVLVYDPVGVVPGFNSSFAEWGDVCVNVLPARLIRYRRDLIDRLEWETIVAEYDFGCPSDRSFDAWSVTIAPTHWMPMPLPPLNQR